MPYIIRPAGKAANGAKKPVPGFKVCKKDEPARCFSKKPLTREVAERQRVAIIISERSRGAHGNGKK
jgi:hypothetical protein